MLSERKRGKKKMRSYKIALHPTLAHIKPCKPPVTTSSPSSSLQQQQQQTSFPPLSISASRVLHLARLCQIEVRDESALQALTRDVAALDTLIRPITEMDVKELVQQQPNSLRESSSRHGAFDDEAIDQIITTTTTNSLTGRDLLAFSKQAPDGVFYEVKTLSSE